jgi:toxin ParE1/3/4
VVRLTITTRARRDLREIWREIAKDNRTAADAIVRRAGERIRSLEHHPELGPARPDFGPGLRALVAGKYLVVYKRRPDEVEIVRVLHGARDLSDLL